MKLYTNVDGQIGFIMHGQFTPKYNYQLVKVTNKRGDQSIHANYTCIDETFTDCGEVKSARNSWAGDYPERRILSHFLEKTVLPDALSRYSHLVVDET